MDVIDIIMAYNPLFSPEKENIIMVPIDYVDQVRELAKSYNARIQIFQKRRSKYAYIRWYYPTTDDSQSESGEEDE